MKQERKRKARLALWTLVFALVAALALLGASRLRRTVKPAWEGGYSVHISEVMTDNLACPNEEGLLWDYVEIANSSDSPFDLGGFYLSDTPGEGKHCFPAGTRVPAGGCLAVWCAPDAEGEAYAPFGLRKEGGETVALMNPNLVSVDEAVTVPCRAGQSLIRGEGGELIPCDTPTPGFPNTEAGAASWQAVLASRSGGSLELGEVMTSNSLYPAPDGSFPDWVELRNPTDRPVALAGYKLSDREEKTKFDLPADRSLGPGEVLVIWCVPGGQGDTVAPFGLSAKGGETLVLTGPTGTVADSVTLPELGKNTSYIKENGLWTASAAPTPGFPNDEAGLAAYRAALGYEDLPVYISEILDGNKGCCLDEDGEFSDWIELWNAGGESVDLTGWYLSDTEEEPDKWPIPARVLAPGEYVRIWASGKNRGGENLHAGFAISAGETVCLVTPNGVVMRSVPVVELDGESWAMGEDGGFAASEYPTPGFSNDAAGYRAFCEQDTRSAPLLLWEIVVSDPDHDDWVELRNVSSDAVDLAGYSLTDRKNDPTRMVLDADSLAPGESRVIELKNFGLNAKKDEVYLFAPDGAVCDFAWLHHIPAAGSLGRVEGENGLFYFASKTPGADNGRGWRLVAADPVPDVLPGVYDGVDSLTVTLSGENVHYTTDGTEPDGNSPLYTGPLTLTETTVLRVIDLAEDQLSDRCATYSYFLNENSSLPIVSLVTAPESLFGRTGIYDHHEEAWQGNWERAASIEFYEEDGSFQIDCGIQIHGRTSRRASDKRSFKLKFRGRYDGDLHYDVFGDGVVTDFSSLLLRGSLEDNYSSYMRDELFAALAMENTDVPAQNYRYVSLYINGQYWGIYAIREHHSENYFASHYGVDPESVDMQTGEFYGTTAWNDLVKYAEANPGAWEYMQQHVDIPEMIDWLILECWSGDFDVYENVRFYGSPQYKEGRYVYGLVDMDLTMMQHDTYEVGFARFGQIHMIIPNSLLGVPEFRDMFLTRLGELLRGPLSEEAVMAKIDELRAQVEPESQRDLQRWGKDLSTFTSQMSNIRNFVEGRNDEMVNTAIGYFGLSADQARQYFG